jgi:hypothetical protein
VNRAARFLQSVSDFPCRVDLGGKVPAWGLNRWDSGGLRFVPPDDEEFVFRGDKRRLVYKGRRRSHRFTILGDTAFESDCILEREPESNVITLLMEGAERFDFFRQPDFVKDPFLKGSYAVYKKETFIGEGTGKLCHIHRPEIIDSRGRRCWGDLSVTGNELRITIPENFLSEAKYPVIVDPTIGTTTVGSQYLWDNNDPGEPLVSLMFELCIPVNRFLASETINGTCTAYIYTNEDDYEAGGRPVLYSDNGNKPVTRMSKNESLIDFRVTSGKPKGWRNGTFQSNGSISSGSYIWFGVFTEYYWLPRFDYGARCYTDWWWEHVIDIEIPNEYPLYNVNSYQDFKLSMYFTYTPAQSYTRTLTQGVTLTDTRKLTGAYHRTAVQTVWGTTGVTRFGGFYRSLAQTAQSAITLKRAPTFIRKLIQQAGAGDTLQRLLSILRKPTQTAGITSGTQRITQAKRTITDTGRPGTVTGRKQDAKRHIAHTGNAGTAVLKKAEYVKRVQETAGSTANTEVVRELLLRLVEATVALYDMKAGAGFNRGITDKAGIGSGMGGMVTFFRTLFGVGGSGDSTSRFITRMRVIQDTGTVEDDTGHTADYLRGLFIEAGSMAGTTHRAEYHRKQQDTAYSEAVSLRHLFIFLRLVTLSLVRDYLIPRFLRSREELVIKSPVVREIILESRVQ